MTKTRAKTQRLNFTKKSLDAIPVAKDGSRVTVFDDNTKGLGLTVYPTGVRTFFHLRSVRGYPQRTHIGPLEEISIEQARGKASALNAAISKWKLANYSGQSPFETPQRDLTLGELAGEYIEKRVLAHASHPEKAKADVECKIKTHLAAWRGRKLSSISKADVIDLHTRIGANSGHHIANRVVQLIRRMVNWAEKTAEIWSGKNPAAGVKLFHEAKRKRFLQPEELPAFFRALQSEKNEPFRDFVLLALWTGARKSDVCSMRWQDVSLADNRWLIPDPKNREPYEVALTPEAIATLRARQRTGSSPIWVFPSDGKTGHIVDLKSAWKKFLKRAGLFGKGLRQHDLRRTLGSYQAAQGTALGIIGKSLGHKSLAATAIYSQLDLDPVRKSVMSATRTIIAASKKNPKLLAAGQ